MNFPVMQKLDRMTPWHVLRYYPTLQEAILAATQFAKDRPWNVHGYSWDEANGRVY